MEPDNDDGELNDFKNEEPRVVGVREGTRQKLAYGLFFLFAFEVLILLGAIFSRCVTMSDAKDVGLIVIAPTTGILGIIIGFFFGEGNR